MMPDFFEIFWGCTLADNGLSIWTTKNASCCGHRMWSLALWSVICDVTVGTGH